MTAEWRRDSVSFFVAGQPVTQGSKVPLRLRDGRTVVVEERRADLKQWRGQIATAAQAQIEGPFGFAARGPLAVTLQFRLPPPGALAKWRRLPWVRPDASKLARAAEDALTKVLYGDDGQIACLIVTKVYALDVPSGVRVTIQRLEAVERDALAVVRTPDASTAERVVAASIHAARRERPVEPEPTQETLLA